MEDKKNLLETLLERVEQYGKNNIELYKLKAIDRSADVISDLAVRITLLAFLAFFFLILNIGISLWIGELVGKTYYGFFLVAGFYALVCMFLYIFRDAWLKTPISNSIITHALK